MKAKEFNWGLLFVTTGCVTFWFIIGALICLAMTGCGVWVEIETDPQTGKVTVLYENRRLFAPENASVKTPDGWEILMGGQPRQAAFYEAIFKAGMIAGGMAPPAE